MCFIQKEANKKREITDKFKNLIIHPFKRLFRHIEMIIEELYKSVNFLNF